MQKRKKIIATYNFRDRYYIKVIDNMWKVAYTVCNHERAIFVDGQKYPFSDYEKPGLRISQIIIHSKGLVEFQYEKKV